MIIAGQILGWLAALFTFISYQCKEHKTLIAAQLSASLSMSISYLFLGAASGMMLTIVCILRNFIIYKKDIKIFSHSSWAYILTAMMGITGALSWQGPMSLLIIVALMINTMFLYHPNVQNLRKSILLTAFMTLIYDIYYTAWGGVANELIAIIVGNRHLQV